jgi:hypothetical protein
MPSHPCHREILARSPVGLVERCSCGLFHLTVGPATLRLEPEVLAAVASMLQQALGDGTPAEAPPELARWGRA